MRAKRPPAPVQLPHAHRVFFERAGGAWTIYWYRRRGQTPAMIQFEGATLGQAVRAEAAGAEAIVQAYNTAPALPPAMNVRDLVARYKVAPNGWGRVGASTRVTWSPWLDAIVDEFGDLELPALAAKGVRGDIVEWRDRWGATPRAADTGMQVINRVFNWGLDRELIDKNPAAGIEGLYTSNRADIIVEPGELAAVQAKTTHAGRQIMRLAAVTGMRRGDLLDLRWTEVGDGYIERAANKSTTGRRLLVPLIAEARAVIAELRAENKARKVPSTHVLLSSRGVWTKGGMDKTWNRAAKAAGVDKHFNDLRGTACTNFYLNVPNLSDEEAADIMAWEPEHCRAIRKRYVDPAKIAAGIVARIERTEGARE